MLRSIRNFLLSSLLFCLSASAFGCEATQYARRAAPGAPPPSPVATIASTPTPSEAINRPTSKPYTGELSIFEDPKRDQNLQPNRIMDILGIKEGSTVADIGAGSGWFTVRAARRVGNAGSVYAVDINRDYLDYIEKRTKRESLANIRIILGREDDPLL